MINEPPSLVQFSRSIHEKLTINKCCPYCLAVTRSHAEKERAKVDETATDNQEQGEPTDENPELPIDENE